MTSATKLEILVVDDHDLVRAGIIAAVQRLSEETTVYEAATIADAIEILHDRQSIDLVLLDLVVPDAEEFDGLDRILRQNPDIPVILLTADARCETIDAAFEKGATGYIPKSSNMTIIVNALQIILAGGHYLPSEMLDSKRLKAAPSAPSAPAIYDSAESCAQNTNTRTTYAFGLTDRQSDVAKLLKQGLSNKEICRELNLSISTVKTHVAAVLRVCRTTSRAKAMVMLNSEDNS